jgi:translocation and assembly module TamA
VNILATGDRVVADLKDKGYFDSLVVDRRAVLDHTTGRVDISDTISAGQIVHVGGFQVTGKTALSKYRVSELAELDVGELLTPKRLKEAETTLQQSALFDLAKADPVGTSPERTIHYTANDRLIHTLSGSVQYSLQDGAAIELSWEDRNLAGDAEKLTTALTLGTETQELNVAYQEYDFWWARHTLIATFDITRQDVDDHPYESAAIIGVLQQKLSKHLTVSYGGSLEYIRDEDQDHGGNYGLVGIRGELTYDDSNDLLDPTEGIRATARLQPYFSYNGDSKQFTIAEIVGSAYIPFDEQHNYVFATRARLGSIFGASLDSVPYPKRFFAGGGGSIRGYGYERAGPIDEQNRPLGGTSVLELNEEFRWRINETFGAVAFVDGGGAFDSATPFSSTLFMGTGLGVRYYSPIGPIRLDVATPLKKQPGDGSIDVYISIGQAF